MEPGGAVESWAIEPYVLWPRFPFLGEWGCGGGTVLFFLPRQTKETKLLDFNKSGKPNDVPVAGCPIAAPGSLRYLRNGVRFKNEIVALLYFVLSTLG